mgnify:CR=1 FL=1
MANKTRQGHSFEYRLANAISKALGVSFVRSDILIRRHSAATAFEKEHSAIATLQDTAAANLACRLAANLNGSPPTGVSITDGSPDDLCIHKASGDNVLISVKWTDGVRENKGPRIGTDRGEYRRNHILGLPTGGVWRRIIDSVHADMCLVAKPKREGYDPAMLTQHMIDLADATQWQFERFKNNPVFVKRLVKSIYGDLDVIYASAGKQNQDGTLRLIKSFQGGSFVGCERYAQSTVITIAENNSRRRLEVRHRVKIKEAHHMRGAVSDYCYNIQDDQGVVFQL